MFNYNRSIFFIFLFFSISFHFYFFISFASSSELSRQIRGYPYGSQDDKRLLNKDVIFKCSENNDLNFQAKNYLIILNNNPDYPLRRMSFAKTNASLEKLGKIIKQNYTMLEKLKGTYLEMNFGGKAGLAPTVVFGEKLALHHGYSKIYDTAFYQFFQNRLSSSFIPYVFGSFEGSKDYKLLPLKPHSMKGKKNILDAKDFDNYQIDCSTEELRNNDFNIITTISRGDLFPGFRIIFKNSYHPDYFDNLATSNIEEKLSKWKIESYEPYPIDELLFFKPLNQDIKTVMIPIKSKKLKLEKLTYDYFTNFSNESFQPQFLNGNHKGWSNFKIFGTQIEFENLYKEIQVAKKDQKNQELTKKFIEKLEEEENDETVCSLGTYQKNGIIAWNTKYMPNYLYTLEAQNRNLTCGVGNPFGLSNFNLLYDELNKKLKTKKNTVIDWKGLHCSQIDGQKRFIWFDNSTYKILTINDFDVLLTPALDYRFKGVNKIILTRLKPNKPEIILDRQTLEVSTINNKKLGSCDVKLTIEKFLEPIISNLEEKIPQNKI